MSEAAGSVTSGVGRPAAEPRLRDPAIVGDPYRAFAQLRELAPVMRARFLDESPVWLVTRYDEVRTVLTSDAFGTDPTSISDWAAPRSYANTLRQLGVPEDLLPYLAESLLERDPPDHTRLRRLVARAFQSRGVAQLRPRIVEITEDLLDAAPAHAEGGVVDLLEHFAYPLPITVICEMVGVPQRDRAWWGEWSGALMSMDPAVMGRAARAIVEHVKAMIEQRRGSPTDDLLSELIRAHDADGDRLNDVELVTMVLTLIVAGHETTANLIANGTAALLTHPDQLALLRGNPGLLPAAVHELQRWCGPVLMAQVRYARRDVELGGVLIRTGDPVEAMLVSGNYDPRKFSDPERLDVTRNAEQQLGWGFGAHHCLGAALARQETQVALATLLRRHPDLVLAVAPDELPWLRVPGMRRLRRLPVRL